MLNMINRLSPVWPASLAVVGLIWGGSGIAQPVHAMPADLVSPASAPQTSTKPVSPQQLQANAEAFVDALFSQQYDQAWKYLAPQAQTENPPAILQRKQEIFIKRTGDFRQRLSSRIDGEIIVVNIEFSNLTDDLIVIMEPGGKIVGVDFPADPNDASAQSPSQ